MSKLGATLDVLEGGSSRFLWLPAISFGYISTISASKIHFLFMIAMIVGARLVSDMVDISQQEEGEVHFEPEGITEYVLQIFLGLYLSGFVGSLFLLAKFFSYDRPIGLGLLAIYLGLISIGIMYKFIDLESMATIEKSD